MTHTQKPTWELFYEEGLGPSLPLSSDQQAIPVSGVLPSGEAAGFDFAQSHKIRREASDFIGSGINVPFPYPNQTTPNEYSLLTGETQSQDKFSEEWWEVSGIFKTYPSGDGQLVDAQRESGILHFNGEKSLFSNGSEVSSKQITDFNIFNNYIHHIRLPQNNRKIRPSIVKIPFVSTFKVSINWNPYG